MRKLIVYFSLFEMTDARSIGERKYKITPMRRDFPEDTSVKLAIKQITDDHGERPEQPSPMSPAAHGAHQFADIRYWTVAEVTDRPTEAVDNLFQPEMFPEFKQK